MKYIALLILVLSQSFACTPAHNDADEILRGERALAAFKRAANSNYPEYLSLMTKNLENFVVVHRTFRDGNSLYCFGLLFDEEALSQYPNKFVLFYPLVMRNRVVVENYNRADSKYLPDTFFTDDKQFSEIAVDHLGKIYCCDAVLRARGTFALLRELRAASDRVIISASCLPNELSNKSDGVVPSFTVNLESNSGVSSPFVLHLCSYKDGQVISNAILAIPESGIPDEESSKPQRGDN